MQSVPIEILYLHNATLCEEKFETLLCNSCVVDSEYIGIKYNRAGFILTLINGNKIKVYKSIQTRRLCAI